jgi:uncharacterized OB-fold protein
MINTEDYKNAPSDIGPQTLNGNDKPHRLVYDLCNEIERLRKAGAACPKCGSKSVKNYGRCNRCEACGEEWNAFNPKPSPSDLTDNKVNEKQD